VSEAQTVEPRSGRELIAAGSEQVWICEMGRRAVDVAGMVAHLDEKFVWAEALPDADHVARLRVQPGPDGVDRLDELVAEIGMGRSILEG